MKIQIHIGLDVHKNSVVVATANSDGSVPQHYGKWGGTNLAVRRGLRKLLTHFKLSKDDVRLCYEAGPTGFVLARHLLSAGYDCILVAPSAIPKSPGDRVKTDRRDARKLARLLRSGDLQGIHIPDSTNEAVRDVCRARTDASEALARCKQQLGMFLLRNGIRYLGKTNWTQSHMNYLRAKRVDSPFQQIVLEEWERSGHDPRSGPEGRAKRVNILPPSMPASNGWLGLKNTWRICSPNGNYAHMSTP